MTNLEGLTVRTDFVRQVTGWDEMRIHRAVLSGEIPRPVNEDEVRHGVQRRYLLTEILEMKARLEERPQ